MKAMNRCACFAAMWAAISVSGAVHAGDGAGTQSVFASGSGNRALAMGSAFVATADDASALVWNPAGLAEMKRAELQFSQSNGLGLGFSEAMLAVGIPDWRWGTGALSVRTFGIDGIEQRDERNLLVTNDLSNRELEVMLGYANRVGSALTFGGALKVQRQSIAGFGSMGVGADAGLRLIPGRLLSPESSWADQFVWALAVRNLLQPSLRLDRDNVVDPTAVRSGLQWRAPIGMLGSMLAEIDIEHVAAAGTALRSGIEIRPNPLMAVRAGMNGSRLTAGTGFSWRRFSLDYAYMDNAIAADHRMGVAFAFGSNVDDSRAAALRREDQRLQARLDETFRQRLTHQVAELLDRAEHSRADGNFDEALDVLGSARTLAPDEPRIRGLERTCLIGKATSMEQVGDFTGAALTYELVLAAAPSDSEAVAGARRARSASERRAVRSSSLRARFEQGLDDFSEGRLAAARREFSAIISAAPADSEAIGMLRRTEAAIARSIAQHFDRADKALKAGRTEEAMLSLQSIAELDPAAPGLEARRTEVARARRITPTAARPSPSQPAPQGEAPVRAKQDPDKLVRLYRQGVEAQNAGNPDEAIRYWELLQSVSPGYRGVDEFLKREYLTRGMEAFAAGRLDEAITDWERVLRISPSDARARGYLERAREQASHRRQILGVVR